MAVSDHHTPDHQLPSRGPLHKECTSDYKSMADLARPTTPDDRVARSSFSSIREHESTLTQTFTHSKLSSYVASEEEAVEDSPQHSTGNSPQLRPRDIDMIQTQIQTQTQFQPPITQPNSKLLGYWTPADSFRGWKEIQVKGKLASKSFSDLKILNQSWSPPPTPTIVVDKNRPNPPGEAPIERLPFEVLTSIINRLVLDIPPNGLTRRNIDLMSLLLTSRTLHFATLETLYSRITIPHSRIFHKFLTHITAHPPLGTIVRRIDFCHFNPSQLFGSAAERSSARNLTSETLLQCLKLTPHLQEFLAQEYIDDDLDAAVLQKLFLGMPRLQAVDFCGCSSEKFKKAFSSIVTPDHDWPTELSIRRLSMHKCLNLPSVVFDTILPRLSKVTHLDLAGTRVTDSALASIPHTARITHLNLAKCKLLSARSVIDFLANHPAVRELQFLSVSTDARTHQLFDVADITELLPLLPSTLKSLSLKGSRMDASHIDLLRPLTKHLEELALGRALKLSDVNRLFVADEPAQKDEDSMDVDVDEPWVQPALRFIDLSDFWGSELDLPYLFSRDCAILRQGSDPLEVVEVAEDGFKRVSKSRVALKQIGWRTSEVGSRGWMVRDTGKRDDGCRGWKMGAENWGMRKIPVARAEVGGMYGFMMFGRKL